MLEVQAATVPPPEAKVQAPRADGAGRGNADKGRGWEQKKGRWRRRGPATSKMTSFWAATLGASGGGAAGLMDSGGYCLALPCASAKGQEVFDDCSQVGRRLSPRDGAIIRELNETVFAMNFLETGGICRPE